MDTSGWANSSSAMALGKARIRVSRSPQSSSLLYWALSCAALARDRLGSKTEPSATPRMAVGNSISRSA